MHNQLNIAAQDNRMGEHVLEHLILYAVFWQSLTV